MFDLNMGEWVRMGFDLKVWELGLGLGIWDFGILGFGIMGFGDL